ncbi:MAG: LuxR C-terminal-related transcriptional regulator [Chloroflexota bacterium]|nr:LuxR C-terminal-related transcriptional regulator [Chloroflexota bacterium]
MIEDKALTRFFLGLTRRQRYVVDLVCRGMSNEQVSEQLVVNPCTVAEHLTKVYRKLKKFQAVIPQPPKREVLISLFEPFLKQHPEMRSDDFS